MEKVTIPTLRRVPAAQLRAQELQARFFRFAPPASSVSFAPASPVVALPSVTDPSESFEIEPGGELYGADGLPTLWPRSIEEEVAPEFELYDGAYTAHDRAASLETVLEFAPSIEAEIAAYERLEEEAFRFGRVRANYACLQAERARLTKALSGTAERGFDASHLRATVCNLKRRIGELEQQYPFGDLRLNNLRLPAKAH